jgi:hypothetical protein
MGGTHGYRKTLCTAVRSNNILLLSAMIGAIVIAKRKRTKTVMGSG